MQSFERDPVPRRFAYLVFYLVKELGFSHREIFGGPGTAPMRVETFMCYVDLLDEHQERKKRKQKKQSLRQDRKSFG